MSADGWTLSEGASLMGRIQNKLAQLKQRELPTWFDEAKFGIFIHWGAFAIPAFAPKTESLSANFDEQYDEAIAMSPYSEWYENAIKIKGTPSWEYHQKHFGGAPYRDFKKPFEEGIADFNADRWAEAFRDAGAQYVVLVTKHHDGLCLWPSRHENKHEPDWTTQRDLVGEVADAVRRAGMRFGVYYSGGIDWSFNRTPIHTMGQFIASQPGGDYPDYAMAQTRELIERYQPSVLWNDISWPTPLEPLLDLFADYYAAVPEGVVNDRWIERSWKFDLLKWGPITRYVDKKLKQSYLARGPDEKGLVPPEVPHSDFRTPEFSILAETQAKKWESTRGMSHGFGYRANDGPEDYASAEDLLHGFIDAVARNGNLLLNVGPRADGSIPDEQAAILKIFGAWLRANGEAIYGTRPWQRSDGVTACGKAVRFTHSPQHLHLIVKSLIAESEIIVKDLTLDSCSFITRLADDSPVEWEQRGADVVLRMRSASADPIATAFRVQLPSGAG
jgi:alpha-L-fucosidase